MGTKYRIQDEHENQQKLADQQMLPGLLIPPVDYIAK